MPLRGRPVIPLAGWRQQQQGAVSAGQCFPGFVKKLCRQGQAELIGLEFKPQGLEKRVETLGPPARAKADLVGAGKSLNGQAFGDVAHRQHQVHLLPFSEVDADLKVGFAHAAEQVGPIRKRGVGLEAEWHQLLQARQKLPWGCLLEVTGHLQGGVEFLTDIGQSR